MPWYKHGNHRYFYRAARVNGRVTLTYLGSGPEAEAAAREIEERRQKRAAARSASQAFTAALAPFLDLSELCDGLMQSTFITNGYHQHHGEWRRRNSHANRSRTIEPCDGE